MSKKIENAKATNKASTKPATTAATTAKPENKPAKRYFPVLSDYLSTATIAKITSIRAMIDALNLSTLFDKAGNKYYSMDSATETITKADGTTTPAKITVDLVYIKERIDEANKAIRADIASGFISEKKSNAIRAAVHIGYHKTCIDVGTKDEKIQPVGGNGDIITISKFILKEGDKHGPKECLPIMAIIDEYYKAFPGTFDKEYNNRLESFCALYGETIADQLGDKNVDKSNHPSKNALKRELTSLYRSIFGADSLEITSKELECLYVSCVKKCNNDTKWRVSDRETIKGIIFEIFYMHYNKERAIVAR